MAQWLFNRAALKRRAKLIKPLIAGEVSVLQRNLANIALALAEGKNAWREHAEAVVWLRSIIVTVPRRLELVATELIDYDITGVTALNKTLTAVFFLNEHIEHLANDEIGFPDQDNWNGVLDSIEWRAKAAYDAATSLFKWVEPIGI